MSLDKLKACKLLIKILTQEITRCSQTSQLKLNLTGPASKIKLIKCQLKLCIQMLFKRMLIIAKIQCHFLRNGMETTIQVLVLVLIGKGEIKLHYCSIRTQSIIIAITGR